MDTEALPSCRRNAVRQPEVPVPYDMNQACDPVEHRRGRTLPVLPVAVLHTNHRAYKHFHPLWRHLTCAFPGTMLLPSRPRQQTRRSLRTLPQLLGRQAFEVRDRRPALQRHHDDRVATAARALGADRRLAGDGLEAVAEAAQSAAALGARARGTDQSVPLPLLPHDPAARETARAADRLTRVADGYRTSPVAAAAPSDTPASRANESAPA